MDLDKPFRTYDEQIDLLQDRGLCITDREFANHALSTISYYDLINGYKNIFMKDDVFLPDIHIEYLYEFFFLDKSIQSFIMKYSLFIENLFKNALAYTITNSFGAHESKYLDSNNYLKYYSGSLFQENVMSELTPLLTGTKIYKIKYPTRHYRENHNHVPPWILFKNISFGCAINLFNVLKPNEKQRVVNQLLPTNKIDYDKKVEILKGGLENIRLFRNTAAHNLSFVTCKAPKSIQPKQIYKILPKLIYLTNDLKQPLNIDKKSCKGLYNIILIILALLNTSFLRSLFINDFKHSIFYNVSPDNTTRLKLFQQYSKLLNLPSNLLERLSDFENTLT